jgi:GT2 family glycosyltransferase
MTKVAAFIPTRNGKPDIDVARRMSAACRRVGCDWGHTANHLSVCTSRNQAVALAKGAAASHLFMCDNDTHIPPGAIERLLDLNAAVATGCTPTTFRSPDGDVPVINIADDCDEYGQPQFYREWFSGLRAVNWCGASCILIDMDVFDTVGFPWFSMDQDWDGRKYSCWSEDLSFCRKLHDHGIESMADGDVRCRHDRRVECGALIPQVETLEVCCA